MGAIEWTLIVLHSIMWGSAYFFGAIALRELPSLTITAFRLIPACIIVVGVCWMAGNRIPRTAEYWRRMLVLGVTNNVLPMMLILFAQHQVSGGIAAVFNAMTPLIAVVLAHFVTVDEKFTSHKGVGIAAGIIGVSVLVGADITSGASGGVVAKLALLGAAAAYAISGLFARKTSREPPFVIAAGQMLSALIISMPLALMVDQPWTLPIPTASAWGAVLGMGVFGSAVAALLYFTVLKRAGATNTLLVTLLLPLTPILLGAAFLGERLSTREWAGAAIIGAALVILDGRLIRKLRAVR